MTDACVLSGSNPKVPGLRPGVPTRSFESFLTLF